MAEGSTDRITQPTDGGVPAFLDGVADQRRRDDARAATELIRDITGAEPRIWGARNPGPSTCSPRPNIRDRVPPPAVPHGRRQGARVVRRDVLTDLARRAWETNHEQPC
jgi:hypothetical protein